MANLFYGVLNHFRILNYMMSGCDVLYADAKPDRGEAYTGGKDAKPGGEA